MTALERLLTIDAFEEAARAVLPKESYDYFRSGADAEVTLRDNREAFFRFQLWPRALVDVSNVSLATTVLGQALPAPLLIAPTAYHRLAHPDGERATAVAASEAGAVYVVSTLATVALEEVAAAAPGPKWFQLYVHKDRGLTRSLIARAEAAGYQALVVTVDTPVLGRRLADEANGFALPPGLSMPNLAEAGASPGTLLKYVAARHDAALTWPQLEQLAAGTTLPLVVKGVLRPEDALAALGVGAKAVIVSNHGGRQLDGVPASLDALGPIADAVGSRCEVLLDGGVRWGTDVLKALGLGARAVLLGRPILWGLTVGGAPGVGRVLELFRQELTRAMALAGCPTIATADRQLVRPRPRAGC